jgi:hypothetical protein
MARHGRESGQEEVKAENITDNETYEGSALLQKRFYQFFDIFVNGGPEDGPERYLMRRTSHDNQHGVEKKHTKTIQCSPCCSSIPSRNVLNIASSRLICESKENVGGSNGPRAYRGLERSANQDSSASRETFS